MTQATEKKGILRAFWEGFKEGWNGSSAQENMPPLAPEEVIEVADEWDIGELQNAAMATEITESRDAMPMPAITAAGENPPEKRGLMAFFGGFREGFKEGWNNPPAYGDDSNKTVYDEENWDLSTKTNYFSPKIHVTYDPVYGSSDAMGMNHEPDRAVYIYED